LTDFARGLAAALFLLQTAPCVWGQNDRALVEAGEFNAGWLTHGRTYAEDRFSPLKQIDEKSVERLGLAWSFDMETRRGLEATPIVANGVLYFTGAWSVVYAVNARSGELLWNWDPKVPRSYGSRACCDVVNRGVAIYKGKIYVGVLDGRLAALDAETGKPAWVTATTDPDQPYTGAPRVVKGEVLIGNGGAELGVRGYVSAYDAETGKPAWRFHTVPGDPSKPFESAAMERAAKTWNGEWWKVGGGGTVWDSLAYDPELDLLYVGTGNGSPWNREVRSPGGGDNLYLSSILALRPDTGELVWHYQTTPGDTWDYTATQHMILAELEIGGKQRKVLMQAPKNGFFYVLDRANGELISAEAIVPITWALGVDKKTGRPIEAPGARYVEEEVEINPGPQGAHNWHPMAYSPATGLVYVPAQQTRIGYRRDAEYNYRKERWNQATQLFRGDLPQPEPPGLLLAWDPVAQQERWRVPYPSIANGGLLATAGNLVFQGTTEGKFVAYQAESGQKLWETVVGTGIIAAPVTYELDGRQMVTVLAGWGGAWGLLADDASGSHGVTGRLLTFTLDGEAAMPPVKSRTYPKLTAIPSDASPEQIERGAKLYGQCYTCHGIGLAGGGGIADLRRSSPAVFASYQAIVREGSYLKLGMPAFKKWLSEEDVAAIRAYVLDGRAALIGGE
jgi:quinohemoprotein ethanol dehydrogenase